MEKNFRPVHQHQDSRSFKAPKAKMCDHQEKEYKHGKINRSKSQQMKQHHQNQGQHCHHYHHQSDHNNGQDFHSAEHNVGDPQPNHRPQRDEDKTHPPHHYRHKLKHRCVSSSSSSSTSSSSSSSTSSSTSSPSSSSSSSFSSSSSVTSTSSSSLSAESSSDCSEKHPLRKPEHSQSCTDISGKQTYLEEGDDTAPLIDKGSDLNRTYPKQKRKISKSSHRGSTKGALKNKGTSTRNLGYDGSFRKAKSMEELPASKDRRRNGNMENDQIKSETKKNLTKEKMKFSAFLNEITRQVLSPMRLTSLGVTDAQRPCSPGQVSARSRETDSSTEKPKQQRSRPTSADSISSSKHSSGSKHSRSSRLSQYKHFQHHGHLHSDPPHNVKHRSRSCNSSFPTSEHHSHLPSHKRHHHHHTSSHHHHHHPEDHNSPIHHHHHRVHHTTSHQHQHRDNHTMSHHHHHGHHHSPVSQHGGHHSSTQHNKENENRLLHYGEDHPGDCCKLTHHHGEQHSDTHIHDHQSHTDDHYQEAHHDHAQHHGDSFNPAHHHEGHQIIPHHHEGHHSSVQHQNPHPKSRPTTPHHHEYHSPTSDYSDHHSPTHHHHGHHHREASQHHHGDHRSGPHNLHHGDHHSLGHHYQHSEYSAEAHRHHHGDHHSPSSHHHSPQHNKESQEHNEDHYGTGNCDEDHKSEIHGHHHRDHNNPGHYHLHHHGDHHNEVHHHRHGHCHNDPHDNHHSEAQHPHGDYHGETHHHPQEDHHSEAHHHHHGDHHSPGHNHPHGDHHSKSHHHHHGDHHSEVHHQPHGGPHSPGHHHGSYHSEVHPRPHGDHHREDHHHHHGDHHSPGHHHGDQQNRAHQHHHGEPHSECHQDHHEIHHTEAHWHGGHHSPGHHHHHGDHLSSGDQHHYGDQHDSGHQHHHGDYHNTSHHQGHRPESKPHPNQSKKNDSLNEHIYSRGNSASSPISHRKQESLVSKLDAPRKMIIPFSQDEEQTSFPSPSTHKEKADDLGKIMILQDENEGLHQSLLKTAVRMECLGEEFISSQKLLETELHRTRIELSDLMDKFKRLHDDCSTTQQTNNLLEQKLHSVTQNMDEERMRLNRRISELTEQLTSANSLETLTVTSVLHKTNLHSLSDDAVTEFVSPIPPPPAQFMDSPKYRKDKTGQELPLGSVPEEEESDWSEMGEETPRLILTGSNRVWRNQEADMDKDSESGGEDFVRGPSPRPLQIPHLQFTLHNDFMSPPHINPSSSGFTKFSDIIPDEKSYRIATNANFKSTILMRSASLEEIPQARHHMQKELRGIEAMMNLHHSEDEAIEDLNNEIIHHWRMSDDRDTVVRLTKSREPELDSSLASLHSAEQMLSHLICDPPSGEGQDPGRAEVHGWVGGIPAEVLKGERTQL